MDIAIFCFNCSLCARRNWASEVLPRPKNTYNSKHFFKELIQIAVPLRSYILLEKKLLSINITGTHIIIVALYCKIQACLEAANDIFYTVKVNK